MRILYYLKAKKIARTDDISINHIEKNKNEKSVDNSIKKEYNNNIIKIKT